MSRVEARVTTLVIVLLGLSAGLTRGADHDTDARAVVPKGLQWMVSVTACTSVAAATSLAA